MHTLINIAICLHAIFVFCFVVKTITLLYSFTIVSIKHMNRSAAI